MGMKKEYISLALFCPTCYYVSSSRNHQYLVTRRLALRGSQMEWQVVYRCVTSLVLLKLINLWIGCLFSKVRGLNFREIVKILIIRWISSRNRKEKWFCFFCFIIFGSHLVILSGFSCLCTQELFLVGSEYHMRYWGLNLDWLHVR